MTTKFVEATNGPRNWGKFMLTRFTVEDWKVRSVIDPGRGLIAGRGWSARHLLVRIEDLPSHVDLPEAEFELYGHRRPGE